MALTKGDREERNKLIIADRHRGQSWRAISESHGITERQCRTVWKEYRDVERVQVEGVDPLDIVFDRIKQYEAVVDELVEVADKAKDKNNLSVWLGAIKARQDALVRLDELLQAVDLLPKNLGKLRVEIDVRYLAKRVVEVFDRYKLPAEAEEELRQALSARWN